MKRAAGLYDQDFYAWAMKNAELIRQGHWADIDLEHVAEELEGMGRGEWYELVDRLAVLLAHLLKWRFQPERHGTTIVGVRRSRNRSSDHRFHAPAWERDAEMLDFECEQPASAPHRSATRRPGGRHDTLI